MPAPQHSLRRSLSGCAPRDRTAALHTAWQQSRRASSRSVPGDSRHGQGWPLPARSEFRQAFCDFSRVQLRQDGLRRLRDRRTRDRPRLLGCTIPSGRGPRMQCGVDAVGTCRLLGPERHKCEHLEDCYRKTGQRLNAAMQAGSALPMTVLSAAYALWGSQPEWASRAAAATTHKTTYMSKGSACRSTGVNDADLGSRLRSSHWPWPEGRLSRPRWPRDHRTCSPRSLGSWPRGPPDGKRPVSMTERRADMFEPWAERRWLVRADRPLQHPG